jgi:alginate O-acetyltransferase complex protein AlgI
VNLLITMALGGLWHGAAWHFVAWGVFWGGVLVLERALPLGGGGGRSWPGAVAGWLVTQTIVLVGWTLFRAESLADAATLLRAMFGLGGFSASGLPLAGVAAAAAGAAFVAAELFVQRGWLPPISPRWRPAVTGAAVALLLAIGVVVAPSGGRAFIYFQF